MKLQFVHWPIGNLLDAHQPGAKSAVTKNIVKMKYTFLNEKKK